MTTVIALLAPHAAAAQAFPSKPIRIIVPSGPGVGPDIVSRTIAPKLAEALGQSVVIENRPGGASTIAASAVANAPPDGYMLFLTINSTLSVLPHMSAHLGFDPTNAFAPVVPRFEVNSYFGLLAPKRTPPEVINRLNAETQKVLAGKDLREVLQRLGVEPAGGTPEQFADYIAKDARHWGPAVKASGAKLE